MAPLADGTYLITSAKDPTLYLEIQSDNVIKVGKKRDIIAQRWNINGSDIFNRNSTYRFENQLTRSFMGVRREGEKAFVAGGYPRIHWQISQRGNVYTIGFPNEDRIVALGEGDLVIFTERTGELDQRWIFTPFVDSDNGGGTQPDNPILSAGLYVIQSVRFPQLAFELQSDSTVKISPWSGPPSSAFQWSIEHAGDYHDIHKYKIENLGKKLVLGNKDAAVTAGYPDFRWSLQPRSSDFIIGHPTNPPDDRVVSVDISYKPFMGSRAGDISQLWRLIPSANWPIN